MAWVRAGRKCCSASTWARQIHGSRDQLWTGKEEKHGSRPSLHPTREGAALPSESGMTSDRGGRARDVITAGLDASGRCPSPAVTKQVPCRLLSLFKRLSEFNRPGFVHIAGHWHFLNPTVPGDRLGA